MVSRPLALRHRPVGTRSDCRVEAATRAGQYAATLPNVTGWAQAIGHNTIFVENRAPLAHGFQTQ